MATPTSRRPCKSFVCGTLLSILILGLLLSYSDLNMIRFDSIESISRVRMSALNSGPQKELSTKEVPPGAGGSPLVVTLLDIPDKDSAGALLTDASKTQVSLAADLSELSWRQSKHESRWCELGKIRSHSEHGLALKAGGDIFVVELAEAGGLFFTRPRIADSQNGLYALHVCCGSLPVGSYRLTAYLSFQLRRDRFKQSDWPTADEEGGVQLLDSFDSGENASLDMLYTIVHKPISGSGVHFRITNRDSETESTQPVLDRLLQLRPCSKGPYTPRKLPGGGHPAGSWINLGAPALRDACQQKRAPISQICVHAELLLPDQNFHHAYVEEDCYYPLMGRSDVEKCLKDRTLAIFGDSVTHGMFLDMKHMWEGFQRGAKGEVLDKREFCNYDDKATPPRYTAKQAGGELPLTMNLRSARVHYSTVTWKPYRQGLELLRKAAVLPEIRSQMNSADIIVYQSCGHDISFFRKSVKRHLFARYRDNLNLLFKEAANWKRKKKGRRFIWMCCSYQTTGTSGKYVTANTLYMRIMNRIARDLVHSYGFEYFNQFDFLFLAQLQTPWWDTNGGILTGDIHHHERFCPKLHNSSFPLLGDKGYLSKVKAHMLLHHVCGDV